jgi:hypothetical protein
MQQFIDDDVIDPLLEINYAPSTPARQDEIQLTEHIISLWSFHAQARSSIGKSKEELNTIRLQLGERLSEMKSLLTTPGRGGQWYSYLREVKIPRATADRFVQRHEQSLAPANCLNESISQPTEEDVRKLVNSVWPKLQRTLTTRHTLELFIAEVTARFEEQK